MLIHLFWAQLEQLPSERLFMKQVRGESVEAEAGEPHLSTERVLLQSQQQDARMDEVGAQSTAASDQDTARKGMAARAEQEVAHLRVAPASGAPRASQASSSNEGRRSVSGCQ